MTIYDIYGKVSPYFRRRRMANFRRLFSLGKGVRILDVGGFPQFWADTPLEAHVTTLNLQAAEVPATMRHRCDSMVGDATRLPFGDGEFDIVFSNSVIEHLGSWEQQQQFAREVRRVGRRYYVQTPAREFPVEPHLLAPFIHWLPVSSQRRLIRYGTGWGLLTKPSPRQIEDLLQEIRLLTFQEFKQLFPDSLILTEKLLGLTKSYSALDRQGMASGAQP